MKKTKSPDVCECSHPGCSQVVSSKSWQSCGWTVTNAAIATGGKEPETATKNDVSEIWCPTHAEAAVDGLRNWINWVRDGMYVEPTPAPQTEAPKRPRVRYRKSYP